MSDRAVAAMFGSLVRRLGGVEAAEAVLRAEFGAASKSAVSRAMNGHCGVTVTAAAALEDAAGDWPITRFLFERIGARADAPEDLRALCAAMAVEAGEAVGALVGAFGVLSEGGGDLTEAEAARALAECRQARDLFDRAIAVLERRA